MTVFAVVDEAGFEAGFDTGDDTFVDVAFALFAAGSLDVEVDELLPINDSDAQFFWCVALNSMRFMRGFSVVMTRRYRRVTSGHSGAAAEAGKKDADRTWAAPRRIRRGSGGHVVPYGTGFCQQEGQLH